MRRHLVGAMRAVGWIKVRVSWGATRNVSRMGDTRRGLAFVCFRNIDESRRVAIRPEQFGGQWVGEAAAAGFLVGSLSAARGTGGC